MAPLSSRIVAVVIVSRRGQMNRLAMAKQALDIAKSA
jgi:hypothetical protein